MMTQGILLTAIFSLSCAHSPIREKRLVLHSSDDVYNEIQNLKTDIQNSNLEIQNLKLENANMKASLDTSKKDLGSIYTRWGKFDCAANGTEKVYSGYTAGHPYNITGGAASYICLPEHPTWAKYIDGLQTEGAYISGTEYESNRHGIFNPFPQNMLNQDAPCAVCRSPRPTSIMIPGRKDCYSGWTMEYTGYLMSGRHTQVAATDYACVDANPDALFHGERDEDGKLFYFVEVKCGSLPCQEYPQGRELACVVCSK